MAARSFATAAASQLNAKNRKVCGQAEGPANRPFAPCKAFAWCLCRTSGANAGFSVYEKNASASENLACDSRFEPEP